MPNIELEFTENLSFVENLVSEILCSFYENFELSEEFEGLLLFEKEELVRFLEENFLLFLREDFESLNFDEDLSARNQTLYQRWIISKPLNTNFLLKNVSKFGISDNFEVINGDTLVSKEENKFYVLEVDLSDGKLETEVFIDSFVDLLVLNYKHINGDITFEILSEDNQIYHYKFDNLEKNWRILNIPVDLKEGNYTLRFSGTGQFALNVLALLKDRRILPNPRLLSVNEEKDIIEENNYASMDKIYILVKDNVLSRESKASWTYLTNYQYKFLKSVFNVPILIERHDFFLTPAVITSMKVEYDRLGKGVVVISDLQFI